MSFSTKECAWAQTSIKVLGRTITGVRGFEFKNSIEKEHLYAAGSKPIDIQSGNEKPDGNLKLLKFEVDLMNDAARLAGYESILHVPHSLVNITCTYKADKLSAMKTIEAAGVSFSELPVGMEQNAKNTEVTLPFLAMDIKHK